MGCAPLLIDGDLTCRDLNKNGRLDPYEDRRRPLDERVEDLLSQMTIEEKAGLMFHTATGMTADGSLLASQGPAGPLATADLVTARFMNHFNVVTIPGPRWLAEWYNRLQEVAEGTRLGIPVTLSSDPRHALSGNFLSSDPCYTFGPVGAAVSNGTGPVSFSCWPDPAGLAAAGDPALVEQFGDIARQEYLAVGLRVALHPMADLATESRWGRIKDTFGEDAALASLMVAAYIRGFQGATLGPESVACMTKHFPGGGPQKDGRDSHFPDSKVQVYPGHNFAYHLLPFEAAFAAGTAQVMPYYSVPLGLPFEAVGFAFNRDIIGGLLRGKYGFDGVVCADWGMLTAKQVDGQVVEALAWGVEHLSVAERTKKALDAGVDQFGGEACPEVIVALVRTGQVAEARIDISARRLLRDKFRLGLFDNPYIDPDCAEHTVGKAIFRAAGEAAQRKSIVLLKNGARPGGRLLPLGGKPKIYIENIAPDVAHRYGQVVSTVAEADVAILRLRTPFEPRAGYLEALIHTGDLDFKEPEKSRILAILAQVPTVVDIYLDRPAVIPEITAASAALLANFGAADAAILDVIFGCFNPSGTLPFELPSSMDAVRQRRGDVPRDSARPLFPFGYGLTYGRTTQGPAATAPDRRRAVARREGVLESGPRPAALRPK